MDRANTFRHFNVHKKGTMANILQDVYQSNINIYNLISAVRKKQKIDLRQKVNYKSNNF